MSILKELPVANITMKQMYVVTNMVTKPNPTTTLQVDEYGFLTKDDTVKKHMRKITHAGRGTYTCKAFCRNIPKSDSRKVSYAKTKEYYCATCSIAMKCVRCHCCGRIGRREPRSRCRTTREKDNGDKYIE